MPMDTSGLFSLYNDSITVIPIGGAIAMADTAQNFGAVDHDQVSTWNLVLGNSGNDLTISSFYTFFPMVLCRRNFIGYSIWTNRFCTDNL